MLISHNNFKHNLKQNKLTKTLKIASTLFFIIAFISIIQIIQKERKLDINYPLVSELPQLAMSGGDPYIRALMLTISASESNHKNSYFLLYGGDHVHNLEQHPNQCIPIKTRVNQGKCSTAAGRYQFLNFTWQEKASKYHPAPQKSNHGISYSFEPEYQDAVVYKWLKDHHQWNIDILTLLKQDRVEEVLKELSGVWTSLGGGIEDNSMTPYLPQLYRYFLAQELKNQKR
ncbi:glycoside hydrolase family 24 protein [Cyanobacterium sp. DS4]|uniref:glycoside hydrolase family 24 protein n=1 Tax=Cyanobacterium sp. DS4 TaxID=2878255 RepID=UPI002E81A8F8|nr:glycoside hydrolase family protein [Cyanobacterium sp. Dongsha4]WVL00045.1 glycoside hydrolase family protein [Cyanobacterium sp. Dongsha4]